MGQDLLIPNFQTAGGFPKMLAGFIFRRERMIVHSENGGN